MEPIHWILWVGAGASFVLAGGALAAAVREPRRQRRIALLLLAAASSVGGAKLTLSLTMKLPPAVAWTLTGLFWISMIAAWVAFRKVRSGA